MTILSAHDRGVRMRVTTRPAWNGSADARAVAVAEWMARQAALDALSLLDVARSIVGDTDGRDAREVILAVRDWMRRTVRYVGDPMALVAGRTSDVLVAEEVATPRVILATRQADCDGSVLQVALLLALGIPSRVVLWGPREDGDFTHVYVEGYDAARHEWVVADWVFGDADQPALTWGRHHETTVGMSTPPHVAAGIVQRYMQGEPLASLGASAAPLDMAALLHDALAAAYTALDWVATGDDYDAGERASAAQARDALADPAHVNAALLPGIAMLLRRYAARGDDVLRGRVDRALEAVAAYDRASGPPDESRVVGWWRALLAASETLRVLFGPDRQIVLFARALSGTTVTTLQDAAHTLVHLMDHPESLPGPFDIAAELSGFAPGLRLLAKTVSGREVATVRDALSTLGESSGDEVARALRNIVAAAATGIPWGKAVSVASALAAVYAVVQVTADHLARRGLA